MSAEFSIEPSVLREAVRKLSVMPGSKGAFLTAEKLVKIEVDMEGAIFTRTTSTAMLKCLAEVEIEQDGVIMMVFDSLQAIAQRLGGSPIRFRALEKGGVAVFCGEAVVRLAAFVEDEIIPELSGSKPTQIKIKRQDLLEAIRVCAPAMHAPGTDTTNDMLRGIAVRQIRGKLGFIATNRNSFHIFNVESDAEIDALITAEGVTAIKLLFGSDEEDEISLNFNDNSVGIIASEASAIILLSALKMPNLGSLIDQKSESIAKVDRDEILGACRSAVPFSSGTVNKIALMFVSGKKENQIKVSAQDGFGSSFDQDVPAKCAQSHLMEYNATLLVNLLAACPSGEIELRRIELAGNGFAILYFNPSRWLAAAGIVPVEPEKPSTSTKRS